MSHSGKDRVVSAVKQMGLKRQIQLQEVIKNDKKKMQKLLDPV